MHTIKPLNEEAVKKAVLETRRVITVEDHNITGGLGSAVAEVIAGFGNGCAPSCGNAFYRYRRGTRGGADAGRDKAR
jgi:hypothetical protein